MIKKILFAVVLIAVGLFGYTKVMVRIGSGEPPQLLPAEQQADAIKVYKGERRMTLLRNGTVIGTYRIALGGNGDGGHKSREGDQKTPEGAYIIDWRNPRSMAHLSLHISYPNSVDQSVADTAGYAPGGNIMIHGLPNGWGVLAPMHHLWDWTDGCIGVSNTEMREIWSKVPNGTPINILP
ncbi:L,D-transpeptidase family protein [Ochrobactrum quorumnocens]|uniref:L,D-transpeptidase catalytic domain protein n=1 Tax=Ochrobactrum quorumnocens TaxID=271865 RepID=A0A248UJ05_9HYPH|nr:L,D-transpeptidase family protein [[Ochrobactrum] quorumnocens]ASV86646.1 L,D-transpeptidase catalytic domain protein [[Ochrobactrum] quorumnocens]KAA9370440.1 L,D-transpeptidase family protein [[Ochrobactrum] quorumnocens]MBD7993658.1 L,D-transpeptidase family protein [Ochrobactrum gallinarum]